MLRHAVKNRMLTGLRFKNWRSLRDVEIKDLTPITVFIGANSSGKTNIVDALRVMRRLANERYRNDVFKTEDRRPIKSIGSVVTEAIELEFWYEYQSKQVPAEDMLRYLLKINFVDKGQPEFFEQIIDQRFEDVLYTATNGKGSIQEGFKVESGEGITLPMLGSGVFRVADFYDQSRNFFTIRQLADFATFVTSRWQLLSENFTVETDLQHGTPTTDRFRVDENGRNTVDVLRFMSEESPEIYNELIRSYRWLLDHVRSLKITTNERETRLTLREKYIKNKLAPTISVGTLRILAMLTAYYALDMRQPNLPGLVIIEEPDTAVNPGVLRNLVEQLRVYTEGEHPRQFILTTHNPQFLNYFEPEEVRVVTRDEQGYTHVESIPDSVREIWLKDGEYGLGEVWMTNSFGGLGE